MPPRLRRSTTTMSSSSEGGRRSDSSPRTRLAIIGGTGALGFGLALRLAGAYQVAIGSRDRDRAAQAAEKATTLAKVPVEGQTNEEAASACDIAILAVRDLPRAGPLFPSSLVEALAGKLVISPIVPMTVEGGVFSLSPSPSDESAAELVAGALPTSRVAGAFHTVPASKLAKIGEEELAYDVLVTADSRAVYEEAAKVVTSVGRLKPYYAGPLRVTRLVEGMTPALLNVGKLNKIRSPSIRLA
jgi:8-hydroxy-5-deazaflavin:NADPH oxidoreductase